MSIKTFIKTWNIHPWGGVGYLVVHMELPDDMPCIPFHVYRYFLYSSSFRTPLAWRKTKGIALENRL